MPENQGLPERPSVLIGYARVSTQDQNAAMQVDALNAAGCEKVFVETVSGASPERPRLHAALRAAKRGDVLVVWKFDRLARSLLHLLETIGTLTRRGVGFVSLTENIDTTTPTGRFVPQVFGALAELEREIIRERAMAGLKAARLRGRIGGRPPKLKAEDLERARELLTDGDLSVPQVAKAMGVSVSTLYARVGAVRGARRTAD
jgi:DNA invertase Pin-like site-specific DNA recombinase